MKWQNDLIEDIRLHTELDNQDGPIDWDFSVDHSHPEITECNRQALLEYFNKVKDNCKAILEIGVCRFGPGAFTYVLLNNKKVETKYIGIDIEDKRFLNDIDKNIHTIQNNSSNYEENVLSFRALGVDKFDFIFIDGDHSINQVLRDWEYTDLLSDTGIVGFHDTSIHPGPTKFIKALNRSKWNVVENLCPKDWGIGFIWRK